jgi:hypothetical protein
MNGGRRYKNWKRNGPKNWKAEKRNGKNKWMKSKKSEGDLQNFLKKKKVFWRKRNEKLCSKN